MSHGFSGPPLYARKDGSHLYVFSSSFYSRSIERICYCRHAYTDGSNGRPFRATSNGSPSVKITREKVLMNDDFTFVLKYKMPRWTSFIFRWPTENKEFHLKWTGQTFTSARKRSWDAAAAAYIEKQSNKWNIPTEITHLKRACNITALNCSRNDRP